MFIALVAIALLTGAVRNWIMESETETLNIPAVEIGVWIEKEVPITSLMEDKLDRNVYVNRIVRALASNAPLLNVGVVGEFGAGKTSLVEISLDKLQETMKWKTIIRCEVSAWGFENAQALIGHVLEESVQKLGEYVDTSAIRQLPDEFLLALGDVSPLGRAVASIMKSGVEPVAVLKRLSPILEAINARLIIVVEDLDRTSDKDFDREKVLATLCMLRDVAHASFVLSGDNSLIQGGESIFSKLCDHIENVPTIDRKSLRQILSHFVFWCYERIGPEAHHSQNCIDWSSEDEQTKSHVESVPNPVFAALTALLANPRTLKHALRRTAQAWRRIKGNAVLHEVLFVNILRFAAPGAFQFLCDEIYEIRRSCVFSGDQASSYLHDKWHRMFTENRDRLDFNESAAAFLICWMLPQKSAATGSFSFRSYNFRTEPLPQGVIHAEPTD
ncbi:MAG: hypothetical protein KDA66_14930, partial [Planctomycetaceae bacterium]|nr:hypothetical protein [Planctomycetaceae bacterium]